MIPSDASAPDRGPSAPPPPTWSPPRLGVTPVGTAANDAGSLSDVGTGGTPAS